MGVGVPGQGFRRPREGGDAELRKWEHGVWIAALLSAAAALLFLPGCGTDEVRHVTGKLQATPSPLDFGTVAVERQVEKTIVLENHGSGPLQIVRIVPRDDLSQAFRLPQVPARAIPGAGKTEIAFGFTPGEEAVFAGRVVIETDSTENPQVEIDLAGAGAYPRIECTKQLDFGRIVLNTDKTLRITCVNTSEVEAELRVVGKEGEDADLFFVGENLVDDPTVIAPGAMQLVEVRYEARMLGRASAQVLLEALGAQEAMQVVELHGEGFASDLVAAPNCLHFGAVNVGSVGTRDLTVYNGGDRPVHFDDLNLVDTSGVFGVVATEVEEVEQDLEVLQPGEQARIEVAFAPSAYGDHAGSLQIRSDDPTNPRLEICLTGRGGGADIMVQPSSIDFGAIAPGMRAMAMLVVTNAGTGDGGPLEIHGVQVDDPAHFTVHPATATVLHPGTDAALVQVEFHPQDIGVFEATLTIESSDGDTPAYPVSLRGEARELPPCDYVVQPPNLAFGPVQKGSSAVLAARLLNVGDEECVFSSVALAPGSDSAFRQPDGPIGVAQVPPGGALDVPVRFEANVVGSYGGAIHFYSSRPGDPFDSIPITGSVVDGCLVASPGAVDFGSQRISCPAATRSVRLTNRCARTVTIGSAAFGAGTTGELQVAPPAMPRNVAPGGTVTIALRYDPVDEGHDSALLAIGTSLDDLSIPVHGAGTLSDTRTDVFHQAERSSVDVLFVVDNSGSMMEEQQAVGEAFDEFINYAVRQGIDYHIGVTTTGIGPSGGGWSPCPGGVDGGEAGRLFPVIGNTPRYITASTPNPIDIFRQNVQVGVCHWWEEGLEAAYRALSPPLVDSLDAPNTSQSNDGNLGFYRPGARLSVIIVTDEDDHSDKSTNFYIDFFRNLKGAGGEDVTVHGVLGDGCNTASGSGDRYRAVISTTGGTVESICTSDWGESLVNLAQSTFGYTLRFPLSGRPDGGVTVTVNGVRRTTGWSYDPNTNQVVFLEASAPPPGARVEISYTPACGT